MMKIKSIGLVKFNNAEYVNLMQRTLSNVQTAGIEKLGITQATMTEYERLYNLMTDIVRQTTASEESAEMLQTDKTRDDLTAYLFDMVRANLNAPVNTLKEAATNLMILLKPYEGLARMPYQQQSQLTRGLLDDLAKEHYAAYVTALSLTPVISQLTEANNHYIELTQQRSLSQLANKLEAAKSVRADFDAVYDEMMTMAFVQSVSSPSVEASAFIQDQNKIIDEVNTAYHERKGHMNKK